MPDKLPAEHHSIADWDFERGAEYRSLADDFFISAPTSLKFSGAPAPFGGVVLCRIPATLVLPQGEIRNWKRATRISSSVANFRNQKPLGDADSQNCYYLATLETTIKLHRFVAGVHTLLDSTLCPDVIDTWIHYSIIWYNGFTPGSAAALCVDVYLEIAGEWVKQGDTMYDTDNLWKDSAINRVGFRPGVWAGTSEWWDNTEIWGPV
ncbi:hypothetical protein ES705_36097 [subsurface metagenome]